MRFFGPGPKGEPGRFLLLARLGQRNRESSAEAARGLNRFAVTTSIASLNSLAFIAGCLLTSVSVQAVEAARRPPTAVQTVLVLGDSLSDGFGLSRAEAYPALLVAKAKAAGLPVEVINASASGGTTAGGLQRLPKYLARPIDVLVVALGINDAFRGVPLTQVRANLQAIIDRTKKRNPNVRVVIAGMRLPLPGAEGYLREFGEVFGELAEKNRAALVPYLLEGVGGDPTLNLPDRIHPNASGQRLLAENVWRVLEPVLRGISEPG